MIVEVTIDNTQAFIEFVQKTLFRHDTPKVLIVITRLRSALTLQLFAFSGSFCLRSLTYLSKLAII